MSKRPIPEQHATHYYNREQAIPRRSSAIVEARPRSAAATHTQHIEKDEAAPQSVGVIGRSVLRHRPIGNMYVIPLTDGTELHVTERELDTLPEHYQDAAQLITPQITAPKPRRQPHPKLSVQDDTVYEMPPARTHQRATDALPQQQPQGFPRFNWLVWVGIALVIMVVGYILVNIAAQWWHVTQDDWHYGRPRTYQTDCNVGHGTASHPDSHFIAENLDKHIMVIEIAGDDPAKTKIYVGPTLIGQGQELALVTLTFQDVNGDGKPDVVIHVGDAQYVFLNTGTEFKPAPNQ